MTAALISASIVPIYGEGKSVCSLETSSVNPGRTPFVYLRKWLRSHCFSHQPTVRISFHTEMSSAPDKSGTGSETVFPSLQNYFIFQKDTDKAFPGILCSRAEWGSWRWFSMWDVHSDHCSLCSPHVGWELGWSALRRRWRRSMRQVRMEKPNVRCLGVGCRSTSDAWAFLADGSQRSQFSSHWKRHLMPGWLNCAGRGLGAITHTLWFYFRSAVISAWLLKFSMIPHPLLKLLCFWDSWA